MEATIILSSPINPSRMILKIPAEGFAPRLFMEWQAENSIELNEVWVVVQYMSAPIIDDKPFFLIKFRSTGADVMPLYFSARDYINNNI